MIIELIVNSIELHFMPMTQKINQSRVIFSEVSFMIFNYQMMMFTEFTTADQRNKIATSVAILAFVSSDRRYKW
jgi:hypothetical protein